MDGVIKDQYGKRSADIIEGIPQLSFPIEWEGVPSGARSLALTFLDFDNIREEGILWVHWLAANIPPDMGALPEDASRRIAAVSGETEIVQGQNTWRAQGVGVPTLYNRYGGPAPERFPHHYELRLYALDQKLKLRNGFTRQDLLDAMDGAVLEEAELLGKYSNIG
jgi:Raf kinase inhibitor-like YbhB/YbcL family protein